MLSLLSLPFVVPMVHCPCPLLSRRLLSSVFVVPAVCHPPFVAAIVVSTSNSPYEQWLVGGLVVLCGVAEVAVGGVVLLLAIAVAV